MKDKKRLLLLFPGPRYHLESLFKRRLEKLSNWFSGSLVTISDQNADLNYGEFRLLAKNELEPRSWAATFRMFSNSYRELINAKKSGRPIDLIVSYDPLKIGLMALVLSLLTRTPYAVEVNGDFYADGNYIDIPKGVRRFLTKKKLLLTQWVVLSRSSGIKKLFTKQLSQASYLKGKLIRVYPDYVDLSIFKHKSEQNNKVILFVGFPYYLKGVDLLVSAFNQVNSDHPEWKLEILGWFQDMTSVNLAIKGNENIRYRKPVYFDEMPLVMAQADILVLPSRTEAMGRVLLEAAAAGVARIGSNAGGIPDVISNEEDGLLFNSGSEVELSLAIRKFIEDKPFRIQTVERAASTLDDQFSEKLYLARAVEFYESVISSSNL